MAATSERYEPLDQWIRAANSQLMVNQTSRASRPTGQDPRMLPRSANAGAPRARREAIGNAAGSDGAGAREPVPPQGNDRKGPGAQRQDGKRQQTSGKSGDQQIRQERVEAERPSRRSASFASPPPIQPKVSMPKHTTSTRAPAATSSAANTLEPLRELIGKTML